MMKTKTNWILGGLARLMFFGALLVTAGLNGCYKRTIAPAVEFDQSQVDAIEREIEKLDWE